MSLPTGWVVAIEDADGVLIGSTVVASPPLGTVFPSGHRVASARCSGCGHSATTFAVPHDPATCANVQARQAPYRALAPATPREPAGRPAWLWGSSEAIRERGGVCVAPGPLQARRDRAAARRAARNGGA